MTTAMAGDRKLFFDFGPFCVSVNQLALLRNGERVPLGKKAFKTLLVLLANRGRVVPAQELMQAVWGTTRVDENNLKRQIHNVRKALDDDARPDSSRYVITVPGEGYKFIGDVSERWESFSDTPSHTAFEVGVGQPRLNASVQNDPCTTANSRAVAAPVESPTLPGPLLPPRGQPVAAPIRILVPSVTAVTVLVFLWFAFRYVNHPAAAPASIPNVGRVFARATSEGGRRHELKLSRGPSQIVVSPDGETLYAIDYLSPAITILDLLGPRVKGTLNLPRPAHSATMTSDGKRMYVGASTDGVMVVDTERLAVLDKIFPTGGPVYSLAVTPDERKLFLAMGMAGLKRILTNTGELRTLSEIACPEYVAIDPGGQEMFVSYQCGGPGGRSGHDSVEIYDVKTEQSLAMISGPPMVGGNPSFALGPPFVLLEGGDACWIPAYDHVGCPVVPSNVYYVLRSTDHKIVQTLSRPLDEIRGVFLPGGRRIAFSGLSLGVVDAGTQRVLERFPERGFYGRAVFTPKSSQVAVPVLNPPGLLVLDTLSPACELLEEGLLDLYSGDGTLDDAVAVGALISGSPPVYAPGVVGQAFHFSHDRLLRANAQGACGDCGDSWSESLFVKFAEVGSKMTVLERAATEKDPGHRVFKSQEDRIVLGAGDQSTPERFVTTSEPVRAGAWYHLVVIADGGSRFLYMNGRFIGKTALPAANPNPFHFGLGDVYIGATQRQSDFLDGWVDEIGFYNRALSASEIVRIYRLSVPGVCRP